MVIESRCISLNLIAFVFKGCGCIPSRRIGVVGERYVQCGESWLFHQTHGVFIIIKSYIMVTILKRFLRINKNISFNMTINQKVQFPNWDKVIRWDT